MVFIKGFFDQKVKTAAGETVIKRNAYRAPMTLDPCDEKWRRYARLFHPWRSKSTLGGKPLRPQYLQVQLYAYWPPGTYYFDNVRLEVVGMEKEGAEQNKPEPPAPAGKASKPGPPEKPDEDEFPVFNP